MRPEGAAGSGRGRGRPQIVLALAAGVVGFLLVTAWSHVRVESETSAGRRAELAGHVAARQRRTADLERELAAVRRELEAATSANARGAALALEEQANRMALGAGVASARGPGVVVTLADSSDAKRDDPDSADFVIQDVDVQLVVNALWDAGAEAVAVNGQRLIGTSAIRSAGGAVLVNYRVLTSPYRIEAVGNADALARRFDASAIAARFRNWADVYHLGFSMKRADRIELPAFAGSVRFRFARLVEEEGDR